MLGRAYFGGRYFGARYFGDGGDAAPAGASAAQIWAYVLSNGKSAGQNLVEINQVLTGQIVGAFTFTEILQILAAVAAGKTTINNLGGGAAEVQFRAVDDSKVVVDADMQGSERTNVTLDP